MEIQSAQSRLDSILGSVKTKNVALKTLLEAIELPSSSAYKKKELKTNPATGVQAIKEPNSEAAEYVHGKRVGIAQSVAFPSPELNPASMYSSISNVKFGRSTAKPRESIIQCRLPVQIPHGYIPKSHLLKYLGAKNNVTTMMKPIRTFRHPLPSERRGTPSIPTASLPASFRPGKYQDATTWTLDGGSSQPNTAGLSFGI